MTVASTLSVVVKCSSNLDVVRRHLTSRLVDSEVHVELPDATLPHHHHRQNVAGSDEPVVAERDFSKIAVERIVPGLRFNLAA